MVKFPELKKKISSFLRKEDGKISKESLIKTGVIIAAVSSMVAKDAVAGHASCDPECTDPEVPNPALSESYDDSGIKTHGNVLGLSSTGVSIAGTHNHCIENCHSSHDSHTSHCNAGTGKW